MATYQPASQATPTRGEGIGFEQTWAGAMRLGYRQKTIHVSARHVDHPDRGPEAQIEVSIAKVAPAGSLRQECASLALTRAQARALAMTMCPELREAVEALRVLVAAADAYPFEDVGHVVEHALPNGGVRAVIAKVEG